MENKTLFSTIYTAFLSKVTDDMYGDTWTEQDVMKDLEPMLQSATTKFRFPRFPIFDYVLSTETDEGYFNSTLSYDEIEILSQLMILEWLTRQLTTYENTKQKVYSSSDFKLSSQANHMDKLVKMKSAFNTESRKSQDLYSRRKRDSKGMAVSTLSSLGGGALDK